MTACIHFIGAGPGAADLITVRGMRLLKQCDWCLYAGSTVSTDMLSYCGDDVRVIDTAPLDLLALADLYLEARRKQLIVARLHSGDLSLYSALAEQLRVLKKLDIKYTLTPGVPAFAAASAALERELTVPALSQSIVLTRMEGRASAMPTRETLEAFAATGATLAIHLAVQQLETVVARLKPFYGANCSAAVVYRATWAEERVIAAPLEELYGLVVREGITRSALILVGPVLSAECFENSALYRVEYERQFKP